MPPSVLRQLKQILQSSRIRARIPKGTTTVQTGSQTVVLHRVRFDGKRKIWGTTSRVVLCGFVLMMAVDTLQVSPDDVFIPFPPARPLEKQAYSGESPEWQTFIRIAKSKEWNDRIRNHVCEFVETQVKRSRAVMAKIGAKPGSDIKTLRAWLDFDYPYYAPQEFEISGLRFTPEAIEWTNRPIESKSVRLLERILWPRPATISVWALGMAVARQKMSDVAKYFGFEVKDAPSGPGLNRSALPEARYSMMRKAIQQMKEQATRRPDEVSDPGSMALDTPSGQKPSGSAGKVPRGAEEEQSTSQTVSRSSQVPPTTRLTPWQVFAKKYAENWKPIWPNPPRGCIAVSGLIELEGERGWLTLDVFGWYNPKTEALDVGTMWIRVRRVQSRSQTPLR
ncbi:hypothetical protein QBC47DRAFT_328192 [Echria macrotheca]|uniref:Uncharacterized protein n=1 Tax=Echria macrotheca TaxID=438768 RepID=A0AAJ0B7R8_9PEZI|nr:hypothetical protein QBC47DRAFT_328192 [Echria macrotheca]